LENDVRKLTIIAPLSALALAACGSPEPAVDNLDAANLALNAMVTNEVAIANDVADVPEAGVEPPAAPAPAPAPAPKAAPKPPAPKPAPTPPEPRPAPEPTCAPEHRAAGHC
jgi:hypothetical protein